MANEMQHKLQGEHNEQFLNTLGNSSEFIDWKFVVLYYSALHFGDAYIARKGKTIINNHDERRKHYSKKMSSEVFTSYKRLENYSQIARYHPEMSNVLTDAEFLKLFSIDFPKLKTLV
ncbi:MAG: hypothetical protein PHH85_02825 [Candidatus Methanoperedens sp.]|nr:hypothetical protein [Candidatus Methanoperedens sp.]